MSQTLLVSRWLALRHTEFESVYGLASALLQGSDYCTRDYCCISSAARSHVIGFR